MNAGAAGRPLHVFMVAGEASGDRLGGALMDALVAGAGGPVRFSGIGGREMTARGLVSLFPLHALAVMGFVAIIARIPDLLARIRTVAAAAVAARPDVMVIIDSPDFTHRVARRVRALAPDIPIVDYVAPAVWAWRPWRARTMRGYVDHVLALLPFEPESLKTLGGPPGSYVGHPLIEELAALRPGAAEARRRAADPPLVLLLPGSRRHIVKRLLPIFGAAVARIGPAELVLPTLPHLRDLVAAETAGWLRRPRVIVDAAEKQAAFRNARAALAASGTVTLELALAGVPTVAAYRVSRIEAPFLRRMIGGTTVILANLVLGENVVPEFLQEDCTPERLADALGRVIADAPERTRQLAAFARLDAVMQVEGATPSARAAAIVLALARRETPPLLAP